MTTDPIQYFRECVDAFAFVPVPFECEDKNLLAFRSKEEFKEWYGHPPFPPGNPYRDEGFYTRELSSASLRKKPKRIVEIGTNLGIGTLILRILNPDADIVSIDNRSIIPAGDGKEYPAGYIASQNQVRYTQIHGTSASLLGTGYDFWFIDGDHSLEGVANDSEEALRRSPLKNWIILWHDYNTRHPGCMTAVERFCAYYDFKLESLPDSSTVWCEG